MKIGTLATAACIAFTVGSQAQQPRLNAADRTVARDVFKQLIETNTSHSVGSTTVAAEAMRKRFLDAGFPARDMVILGPDDRHGNLVLRYHGKPGSTLEITLKYSGDRTRTIAGIKRVSKPGLRIYARADKIPRVLGGLGVAVVSTSKGLMTNREARKRRMGGEVLCYVW